ncbi:MAG: glycosyltransferase family 2 protein [Candidatus Roizmanbacteria bacterium]|nr:glycosyltransferase family 2 protein [Candidatus Roizmanbacteria bacterium]
MSEKKNCHPFLGRVFDLFIPVLSWFLITLPLWLSPFHPALVAYFIIAFDLYFLYNCLETVYYSTLSYNLLHSFDKIIFHEIVKEEASQTKKITHFIVIPNYKEPLYKLKETLDHMVANDYPFKKIVLMLAFEKREMEAVEKAVEIKKLYGHFFADIIESYHVLEAHEEAGKASNQTAAARIISSYVKEKGLDPKEVVLTICDADSVLPKNYFSYLTHSYVHDKDNIYHFYWAPVLLYNNFWQLPLFIRIQATLSSIMRLAFLSQRDNLIQISTYSVSLWLIHEIDYWDVDIIPEDWHVYLQAFFKFGDKVKTIPIYTLIGSDAVFSGNLLKTFTSRYEQEKRWAWGVSDIGYALRQSVITPHIPFRTKFKKILFLSKNHLLWPVSFFILTVSASIPPLINPAFKNTVLGFLLPQLSGFILTISSSMILVYVYIDINIRKKMRVDTSIGSLPLMIIQWYFLPFISFFLSALPALESHTRIILKKNITYKVTEKV